MFHGWQLFADFFTSYDGLVGRHKQEIRFCMMLRASNGSN